MYEPTAELRDRNFWRMNRPMIVYILPLCGVTPHVIIGWRVGLGIDDSRRLKRDMGCGILLIEASLK